MYVKNKEKVVNIANLLLQINNVKTKKIIGKNLKIKSFFFIYLRIKKIFITKNITKENKCRDEVIPILGSISVLIPEEKPNRRLINGKYVSLLRKSLNLKSSSFKTE